MSILNAQGEPVATKRTVQLQIVIIDRKPGESMAEKAVLGFELDSNSTADIANLLQTIQQAVLRRLHDIGFMGEVPGTVTGGVVDDGG